MRSVVWLNVQVKSIQMFHQSVRSARQGDRAALCVTNIDAKAVERGIVTKPGGTAFSPAAPSPHITQQPWSDLYSPSWSAAAHVQR